MTGRRIMTGFTRTKDGNQTAFVTDRPGNSGIKIIINKKDQSITVYGWYDSFVGIEGGTISMEEIQEAIRPKIMAARLRKSGELKPLRL